VTVTEAGGPWGQRAPGPAGAGGRCRAAGASQGDCCTGMPVPMHHGIQVPGQMIPTHLRVNLHTITNLSKNYMRFKLQTTEYMFCTEVMILPVV
jgi:hypothetical protein